MPQGKGTYGSKVGRPRKYQAGQEIREKLAERRAEGVDAHEQAQMEQLQEAGPAGPVGPGMGRMEGAPPRPQGPAPQAPRPELMKEMGSKAGTGAAAGIPGAGAAAMARQAAGAKHDPAMEGMSPAGMIPVVGKVAETVRGRGGVLAKGGAIKSSNMLKSGGSTGGNGIL